jgi:kinesin family protein 1
MLDARTFVNGKLVPSKSSVKLLNGFRVILGDFHVFRFNDPAAVRAQRQKLHGSASIGDFSGEASPGFRSESPFRGAEGELMDWSAARREVADIEKLGDQDLDKLFDDIVSDILIMQHLTYTTYKVKVRTLRKRPDSRYDIAAELESRLIATSQTDETLENGTNPWAAAHGTTLTTNSIGTPQAPELDALIAEERSESAPTEPALAYTYNAKAEDAQLEQQHLTKQLQNLTQEVKRMRSQAAVARALQEVVFEPAHWSARELRLVQGAVERWKRLRNFTMAEEILSGAVLLREANVIA